jgi:TetR/AcrR family transcriptional repressor of nem operon
MSTTKQLIIDVASRLICVHGYNNTSLDDILRESGVGKGNFYHYFKSKEALAFAIIDQVIVKFSEKVLEPVFSSHELSSLEKVERFLDRVVASQRRNGCVGGCPIGNLAMELSDVHEGFRQRLAEVFCLWQERIEEALVQAKIQGSVSDQADPRRLAHFLVASLEGAILLTKVTKEISVMEQCAKELTHHLDLYRSSAAAPA